MNDIYFTISRFECVSNAEFVESELTNIKSSLYIVLNGDSIISHFQLCIAVAKSLRNSWNACMKGVDIIQDIKYNLSMSGRVQDAAKQFALNSNSSSIVIYCIINPTALNAGNLPVRICDGAIESYLKSIVEGHLTESKQYNDYSQDKLIEISKVYRLTPEEITKNRYGLINYIDIENAILTRLALKNV